MERSERMLAATFREAMKVYEAMRKDGSDHKTCAAALETSLRAAFPTPPWEEWPEQFRQPRCHRCDGYGLVLRDVVNRLGCRVTEGTPCTCWKGDRYKNQPKPEADFTEAGKATAKPKGFSRWNG